MSPAVTLHTGMCRSKAVCEYVFERGKRQNEEIETYSTERQTGKDRKCIFHMVEPKLRFSQGHPLTYDIHGARLSLSLGRSPSAPADKTSYFACSRQTKWLCNTLVLCGYSVIKLH